MRIKLTFPGEVIKSNGDVSGRSVTWHPKPGGNLDLTAAARDSPGIPVVVTVAAGTALLISLVGGLVVLRRRRGGRGLERELLDRPFPSGPG